MNASFELHIHYLVKRLIQVAKDVLKLVNSVNLVLAHLK
jgi:hypothetical protein